MRLNARWTLAALAALAVLVSVSRAADAQGMACGDLQNAYGPYDYRTATEFQKHLVEGAHFTPEVESLKGARGSATVGGDIDYTLRAFPNHPAERQKLLIDLSDEEDLDVTVWLERLTADADPAVRAGAARVAVERRADLASRLEQMSRSDPDATVRRIAGYYHQKMLSVR